MNSLVSGSAAGPLAIQVQVTGSGPPGKSAFESALEGGFSGTEQEFCHKLAAMGASGVVVYPSRFNFPNMGEICTIYLDTGVNKAYRWDETRLVYEVVGSDYEDIQQINGGNAIG